MVWFTASQADGREFELGQTTNFWHSKFNLLFPMLFDYWKQHEETTKTSAKIFNDVSDVLSRYWARVETMA